MFKKRVAKEQLSGAENLSAREALFSELTAGTIKPKFTYGINGKTVNVTNNSTNGNCGRISVRDVACTPESDIIDCTPEECDDGGDSMGSGFTIEVKGGTTYVFELADGYEGRSVVISFAGAGESVPMEMESISEGGPVTYDISGGETVHIPYTFMYENSYRPELSSTGTREMMPECPSRVYDAWKLSN